MVSLEDQDSSRPLEQSLSALAVHSHHLGGLKDTGPGVPPSEVLSNCLDLWPKLSAVTTAPQVIVRYSHC